MRYSTPKEKPTLEKCSLCGSTPKCIVRMAALHYVEIYCPNCDVSVKTTISDPTTDNPQKEEIITEIQWDRLMSQDSGDYKELENKLEKMKRACESLRDKIVDNPCKSYPEVDRDGNVGAVNYLSVKTDEWNEFWRKAKENIGVKKSRTLLI